MWKIISKLGSRVDGKVRGIEKQVDLSRDELRVAYDGFFFLFVQRYTVWALDAWGIIDGFLQAVSDWDVGFAC
ncbi:unnamed protein product [Penicillium roqueforti FM164]|uniref:Genomic scaffold, ProqFM164S04 n=1 Tax=Penicillium roqueforti (strain FM164) TaxID=1365484 RepID=W6R0M0_PENRF|nr:unnamed protein product [Penicillium roqueforti FM164]